ncbi:MAG TPA: CoA transferase [Burkholderiales bacterium]|jgi:crotonobetainyl-CoA:carnitine CoA-transferase CaiB-like acyl-CoA transferase|nr:CoA transferase [Burkholderiales bacterium]
MIVRPFEGVRVLDFTRVVSGPYCTQLLGLLGAEIIKVEDRDGGDSVRHGPGDPELKGGGLAATFVMFNAGKKSLTLDLKKPEAKAVVMRLARSCDVAVENFRAGVIDRLGFGYLALSAENPRIIFCSISGFGQTGPDCQAPAFDGNIQAMSGMMAISGEPDGDPMRAGYSVADTGTGLQAALAISAALYQRNQTGQGQHIDVAMLDSAISLLSQSAGAWLNAGIVQKRRANMSISREPTSDTFRTADGTVMLAVMRDDHFAKLARALGLGHLAEDPRCATREGRVANTELIKPLVQDALLNAGTAEWKRRLDEAGVPCSPVLELAAALSQPQVEHRRLVVETRDEKTGRTMRSFNTAFQYAHGSPGPAFPPQRLGAQNEEVLTALGYSPEEIAELARREVI